MLLWHKHPKSIDRQLKILGHGSITIYVALLILRDLYRLCFGMIRDEEIRRKFFLAPVYTAFITVFHVVSGIGMSKTLSQLHSFVNESGVSARTLTSS